MVLVFDIKSNITSKYGTNIFIIIRQTNEKTEIAETYHAETRTNNSERYTKEDLGIEELKWAKTFAIVIKSFYGRE